MAARNTKGVCFQYSRLGECLYGSTCKFQHVQFKPTTAPLFPVYRNVKSEDESEEDNKNNDPPLERFFAKHSGSGFKYNPKRLVIDEFNRLCSVLGLDPDDKGNAQVRVLRRSLKDAMVLQFNSIYGTDVNSVASWQSLCRVLGISPVPATLDECRMLVTNTHVNLVDLVDARGTRVVKKFPSEKALSTYTLETKRFFPREHAHAGGLLKALLRHILHPPDEAVSTSGNQKRIVKRTRGGR